MAKTNLKAKKKAPRKKAVKIPLQAANLPLTTTHPGAIALKDTPEAELRRAVLGCMLWENQFYESGASIADRIIALASKVPAEFAADLAVEARNVHGIRHAPLLLLTVLAKTGSGIPHLVQDTVYEVVSRADELGELLSIYWKNGKKPLPAQFKKGLARAFGKFDGYQLAKYNRDGAVKLRDVAFLTHPIPSDPKLMAQLVNKDRYPASVAQAYGLGEFTKLEAPDTWEVNLSAGKDKAETFTRMLRDRKLGYLALLRNLRNMIEAKVDRGLIRQAILERKGAHRVFPFRFIAAARACPEMFGALDQAFLAQMAQVKKLPGTTVFVVDVSGSMHGGRISKNSDMVRMDGAAAMAAIIREVCEDPIIYATAGYDRSRGHKTALVPPTRGIGLADAIVNQADDLGGGGIFLRQCIDHIYKETGNVDRVIVVTDEQDCDRGSYDRSPLNAKLIGKTNYIINVSSYSQAITYDDWVRVSGFSESVVAYIMAMEGANQ